MTERPLETGWLADTPVDDNLVRQFLHSQADVDAAYTHHAGGRHEVTDDLFLSDTGGAVPFLNQSTLRRPLTGPDDGALAVAEAFAPADRPSVLLSAWPTPDLSHRGWSLVGHPALVVRAPGPLDDRWDVDAGVIVVEATTPEEVAVAERVFVDGYPIPWAQGGPAGTALPASLVEHGVRVRVAHVDGEPAAVGLDRVGHGVVNLCGGAALPAARRRGAWKALVRARVLDAPDLPAVAYTSDDSRPGFARLGFLVLLRVTLWGRGMA